LGELKPKGPTGVVLFGNGNKGLDFYEAGFRKRKQLDMVFPVSARKMETGPRSFSPSAAYFGSSKNLKDLKEPVFPTKHPVKHKSYREKSTQGVVFTTTLCSSPSMVLY
jgi:hypothetical protein